MQICRGKTRILPFHEPVVIANENIVIANAVKRSRTLESVAPDSWIATACGLAMTIVAQGLRAVSGQIRETRKAALPCALMSSNASDPTRPASTSFKSWAMSARRVTRLATRTSWKTSNRRRTDRSQFKVKKNPRPCGSGFCLSAG